MKVFTFASLLRLTAIVMIFFAGTVAAQAQSKPSLFVVHFETGPGWDKSKAPVDQAGFKEHSANLNRLRKDGVITFGARYAEFGMIVLEAESQEAAKALIAADPGVKAGIFTFRIDALKVFYPWQQ